ncbi:hypothetical protein [Chitinivorax sp. B]|uniref:hypothetical protein n=1 Tax=Chitinivorax sp. B TaxID=2502235 RepID=UPI0010F4DF06|nr:hypothetical protein [Chitinivorax sp. B]
MDRRLRIDLTDKLTHWLKPTVGDIVADFSRALASKQIAGTKPPYILGSQHCVGFTETPLNVSAKLLASSKTFGINYAPVGFVVDRNWLFRQGARPVIYQTEAEATQLPDSQLYRHVTLDPDRNIDFTWKREWRVPTQHLILDERYCTPVVPSVEWLQLIREGQGDAVEQWLRNAIVLSHFL